MRGIVVKCKKSNCELEIIKIGLCKKHYYIRNTMYKYLGYKNETNNEVKIRKCLQCDRMFKSTGNRKCESCNSSSFDESMTPSSLYVSCG